MLHTTPPICPERGGSMTEVKGNGSSKKLLPGYLKEYLWKEGPTVSHSKLMHIAELHSRDRENYPIFMITIVNIYSTFFFIDCFTYGALVDLVTNC